MVRHKDGDGVKSNLIISEVQKRACLFDTTHPYYVDRTMKAKSWEEVYESVVPGWSGLGPEQRFAAGKDVQKRWRSIRDSYTKAYRQGKCVLPEECPSNSRRYQYHRQMSFLLRALKNKKPRLYQDKYEVFSEVSSSPHHIPEDLTPKLKCEIDNPLNLKTKSYPPKIEAIATRIKRERHTIDRNTAKPEKTIDKPKKSIGKQENTTNDPETTKKSIDTPEKTKDKPEKTTEQTEVHKVTPEVQEYNLQGSIEMIPFEDKKSPPIKVDANSILPDDYFEDDKLFMNSLLPSFKKMDDDTRLLCRIEVLKIIRYALQGHKNFENLRMDGDHRLKNQFDSCAARKEEVTNVSVAHSKESTLSMTTRSADGSRPLRKKRCHSPYSPLPTPPAKKRGPGRPRKIRPPCESEWAPRASRGEEGDGRRSVLDSELQGATNLAQLETTLFMKMYNLERAKNASTLPSPNMEISVKSEPLETHEELT